MRRERWLNELKKRMSSFNSSNSKSFSTFSDEYALRLEEQGQLKGFAPAKEAKAEAKAEEAPATEAKEAPKKKGK